MKWLAILLSILLVLSITLYTLLFTPFGNGLLKPVIEGRLNAALQTEAVVETFVLDTGNFEIVIALTPANTVRASGSYSLFSRSVDAVYNVAFEKMSELEALLERESRGQIHISGTVKGDADAMAITGDSDIASSKTHYDLILKAFNPAEVSATIKNAKLNELLALAGEKAYADAVVSLVTDIKGIDVQELDGKSVLLVKNGRIDRILMRKDFNVTLPKTVFDAKVISNLNGKTVVYDAAVNSNLLTFDSKGNVVVAPLGMDLGYALNVKELALLRPLSGAPLRGAFATKGSVKGDESALRITGTSDIAGSDSRYDVTLAEFKPFKVLAKVNHASLSKLLYMAGEEQYADGNVNLDVDLTDLDPKHLQGRATLDVGKGRIFPKLMHKAYGITVPKSGFTTRFNADLKGEAIDYGLVLRSNLATIDSKGSFAPDTLESDITYDLNIKELALFRPLTNTPLRGPLSTNGQIKGDRKTMRIEGRSDIAASETRYDVSLKEMQLEKLQATIKNARLEKLIYMSGQPGFASGVLNVDLHLDGLDPDDMKGNVNVAITEALFNEKVLREAYKVNLPKTAFSSDLSAELKGREIAYAAAFASKLAKIDSKGRLEPKSMAMDLDLQLAIAKLELLKPVTGAPLRGPLALSATAKGDKKSLKVSGKAKIAGADADFTAGLESFSPRSVKAKVADLQLSKLLYMVGQPNYAQGLINIDADIDDARPGRFSGNVKTTVSKGEVNTKTVEKAFAFTKMPTTTFSIKTVSHLSKDFIDTKVNVESTLANLNVERARFDVKKVSLHADYLADVPDLDRLYFATERHLKGSLKATGELSKTKDLDFTAHTKLFGGTVDAKLHNDDLHADMKKLNTLGILKMIIYPEVFDSTLDGRLDYNLAKKSGTFHAKTTDGRFTRNVMLDLVKQYGRTDLYKENFVSTFDSRIKEEHIRTDLVMRSNKSSIIGKNVYLNSQTKQVDAKLDINANNNPLKVELKGRVDQPKVKVDASKLIEKEIKKEAGKQINKLLKGLF